MNGEFKLTCLDQDMRADDVVGERTLKVKGLCSVFLTRNKIPMFYKNQKSCEVTIETKYTPNLKEVSSDESTSVKYMFPE